MKVVGLTGGIGSGKSTVAHFFEAIGVAVYISDIEAKKLMNSESSIQQKIVKLLGEQAYINGELNRKYIASQVFNNKEMLTQLNAIVHPAVAAHFEVWKRKQQGKYVIKESAILFENKQNAECDYTILVCAPVSVRVARVEKRDGITKEQVHARLTHQWSDDRKKPLASFIINNMNLEDTKKEVLRIHHEISSDSYLKRTIKP